MQNRHFTFSQLHEVYEWQIVSSFDKTFGRTMLGEELCCLHFWQLHDSSNKGWMTLEEVGHLLRTLKFDQLFVNEKGHLVMENLTMAKFKREFEFNLQSKLGELRNGEDMIRFDLVRDIFLERGL